MILEVVIALVTCLIILGPIFAYLLYRRNKWLKKHKQWEHQIMQDRERKGCADTDYLDFLEEKGELFNEAMESDNVLLQKISEIKKIDAILCQGADVSVPDKREKKNTEFLALRSRFLNEAKALNDFEHEITHETSAKDIEKMCAALHGRIQTSRTYFEFVLQRLHDIVDAALKIRLALYYGDDQQKPASPSAPKLSAEKAALFSRDKVVTRTTIGGARVGFGRK